MRLLKMILISSLVATAMAVPASAQEVNAPPGNAGVDEYLESVPQADGNRPTYVKGAPGTLPADARAQLEQHGPEGAATAQLAEATGPRAASADGGSTSAPATSMRDETIRSTGSGSLADRVARTATGSSSGMGLALPIILALALGVGGGAMVARRRRMPTNSGPS